MKASDIMTSPVVTVRPDTAVEEIAALLVERRISAVPVLEDDRLVGMVSEADLAQRADRGDQDPAHYIKSRGGQARDLMTHEVVSVAPDAPAGEIASLLGSFGVRRVPVLEAGRLVGIVSRSDLVRAMASAAPGDAAASNDDALRAALLRELGGQHWWRRQAVAVAVEDGIVRFSGAFDTEETRHAAFVAARNVLGVRGVEQRQRRAGDGTAAAAATSASLARVRRAVERIHSRMGWLETYYSLSFEDPDDPRRAGFGVLRALNEKLAHPGGGSSSYGQREVEVILYVLEGELVHQTTVEPNATLRHGVVERLSAGAGVHRSLYGGSRDTSTRYLEIWIQPKERGRPASCERREFPAQARRGRLCLIASPEGREESLRINQDARLYSGLFNGAERAQLRLAPGRASYVHVARGRVTVNGKRLDAGDALMDGTQTIALEQGHGAEVLVFDLPAIQP
jgi:quercetin 2,3-dioxygenase